MDIITGTTLRKVPQYRPKERYIHVMSEDSKIETVDIFDNVFYRSIPYSIKKHKRWLISSILSDSLNSEQQETFNDENSPIKYNIFQSSSRRFDLSKANYMFDSVCRKEVGSRINSDKWYSGSRVNYKSMLKPLSKPLDGLTTCKEKRKYSSKNKTNFKISKDCFALKDQENILTEENNSKSFIYMNEIIPINNPLSTKIGQVWHSSKNRIQSKYLSIEDYISDNDYDYDETIPYNYDDNDDNNSSTKERIPFVISQNDMILRKELNKEKKRKRKHSENNTKNLVLNQRKPINNVNTIDEENNKKLINDNINFIIIKELLEVFMEEMKSISEFCKCWISENGSGLILVDLDYIDNVEYKNFIILKLSAISAQDDLISIKVIFNLTNINYNDIYDTKFDNIRDLITDLQSRLDQEPDSSCGEKENLLTLKEPMEMLANTWQTEDLSIDRPLYCLNDEWNKHEFDINKLQEIINKNKNNCTNLIERCDNCMKDVHHYVIMLINKCHHKICENCIIQNLACQLTSKNHLTCVVSQCQTVIDCVIILSLVSFKKYHDRIDILQRQVIENEGSKCHKCHSITIINYDKISPNQNQLEYICKCGIVNCGFCGERQHWPTSCDQMKTHNKQIKKLNDTKFNSLKPVKSIKGRNCKYCKRFVTKPRNMFYTTIKCRHCEYSFCYRCCDSEHDYSVKCQFNKNFISLIPDLTNFNPFSGPDSLRSKSYCQSIDIRNNLQSTNVFKLKQKLMNIDTNLKNFECLSFDRQSIVAQYSQILSIVESIYVSVYQLNRKTDSVLRNSLKISARNLMFYIYRFQSIIDELNECFCVGKSIKLSNMEIEKKYEKIKIYLNDALNYVMKLYILIH